jgi:hypothetical protein
MTAVLALERPGHGPAGESLARYALPAAFGATAVLGALGAIGSFAKVSASAELHHIDPTWLLPIGVDGAIAVFTALDLALAREGKRVGWLRWFAWGLIAATVALNVSGESDAFGYVAHAALPLLWAATVEAAKAAMITRATAAPDRIPLGRWLYAPWPTLRLHRRMRVWGIASYAEALELERRRVLARLIDRHGSLADAPARKRELYRLIAAAAGIDVDEPPPEVAAPPVEPGLPAARPAPARKARARRRAPTREPLSDEDLATTAAELAKADPGVLSGWRPMAEALRAKGHGLGTDRARRVLELARRLKEEAPDA